MVFQPLRHRLVTAARGAAAPTHLDEALLLSSGYAIPDLPVDRALSQLDQIADQARPIVEKERSTTTRVAAFSAFMAQECGFRGNLDAYYDPRNSHLHEVLDRKLGVPITLSSIYIEVARRAGLALDPISFPFHFLVAPRGEHGVYLDPFHGGRQLDTDDCKTLLREFSQGRLAFRDEFLWPVGVRDVAVRAARNLKVVHLRESRHRDAIACLDVLLIWRPELYAERRDRGLLHAQVGSWSKAIDDLERYLAEHPQATDRLAIEIQIQIARAKRLKVQ